MSLFGFFCHHASALSFLLFFFNDPATTEIYTLSLHDALPIYATRKSLRPWGCSCSSTLATSRPSSRIDRKSTRLNSSHPSISYAVFCLKKKKKNKTKQNTIQYIHTL